MSEKVHDVPKRPGGDKRGSSKDRAARKNWMLSSDQFKHTEGHSEPNVHCAHCGTMLTYKTVEADRVDPGKSYARKNIQPACRTCNSRRSNNTSWVAPNVQTA